MNCNMRRKSRLCTECHAEMGYRLISMLYEEKGTAISVEVVGIPANVCSKCNVRLISGAIAKYIDTLVDTLFDSSKQQKEKLLPLPIPHITIWFSSQIEMAKVA